MLPNQKLININMQIREYLIFITSVLDLILINTISFVIIESFDQRCRQSSTTMTTNISFMVLIIKFSFNVFFFKNLSALKMF